ncbi:Prostate and testis expressed protein 3 [Manis javanica]|nr:Prostate and testis expressed protein 3 [Manis javanica]
MWREHWSAPDTVQERRFREKKAVTPLRCVTCHLRTQTDRCRRGFGVCVAQIHETCLSLKIFQDNILQLSYMESYSEDLKLLSLFDIICCRALSVDEKHPAYINEFTACKLNINVSLGFIIEVFVIAAVRFSHRRGGAAANLTVELRTAGGLGGAGVLLPKARVSGVCGARAARGHRVRRLPVGAPLRRRPPHACQVFL